MFQPEISIADSQIHLGRKVWLWHLPGDATERHGVIPDIALDRSRDLYLKALADRFTRHYPVADVRVPTEEEIRAALAVAVVDSLPETCGCGRNKRHQGLCLYRRQQGLKKRLENSAAKPVPDLVLASGKVILAKDRPPAPQRPTPKPSLNTPEPPPQPGAGPAIWDMVIADMQERDAFGTAKYGQRLVAGDGRNSLIDAYQESLDLPVYLRKAIAEGAVGPAIYKPLTWEEQLLAKFPAFDPTWPKEVQIEWFAAFGSLMRVKP